MPATPRSQEQILVSALAALTEDDIPPGDADRAWPDPDTGRPAELAGLSGDGLDELVAAAVPAAPSWRTDPSWPADRSWAADRFPAAAGAAGWLPRDGSGGGTGFCAGGELDVLAAGLPLAGFAEDAHAVLPRVSGDALIGVLRAWRRVASWATARELAAVAELARRRPAAGSPPGTGGRLPLNLSEFLPDEVAAALTLTRLAAEQETQLALDLAGPLAATAAALAAGRIDPAKTKLIAAATAALTPAHAAAVQAAVLPGAPDLTTGQLRRALARAVLTADPGAARRQREEALKDARVDCFPDPAGTATLAGRNLPAAQTLAADKRLCRIARSWQKLGAAGGMDLLRARAYLALLLGLDASLPPADLTPPAPGGRPGPGDAPDPRTGTGAGRGAGPGGADDGGPGTDGQPVTNGQPVTGGQPVPAGLRQPEPLPPLAGQVNLTIPLSTLLGLSDRPGEAAGYGPVDPDTARALACAAAGHRATRWHITVTGPAGRALGYGSSTGRPASTSTANTSGEGISVPCASTSRGGWAVSVTAEPIAAGCCDHRNAEPGYRPSPALQRIVRDRSTRCTAPGCGRPAVSCDLDHTTPHDQGGITCECNLAPLCRLHHRLKQDENWKLQHISPGVMAWLTPAGRRYITIPSQHPT